MLGKPKIIFATLKSVAVKAVMRGGPHVETHANCQRPGEHKPSGEPQRDICYRFCHLLKEDRVFLSLEESSSSVSAKPGAWYRRARQGDECAVVSLSGRAQDWKTIKCDGDETADSFVDDGALWHPSLAFVRLAFQSVLQGAQGRARKAMKFWER